MSDKFIDKSRLNVDNSTNAASIASLVAAASIVGDGLHRHPSEFFAWGPQAIGLVVAAFSQWMQGTPSQETKLIKSVLQLEGETNAQLVRSAFRRVVGAGVVPGLDAPVPGDDVGRFGAPERRGDAALDVGVPDYDDRGAMPAPAARVAEDYFDRQRREGRRLPNIPIAGTDITPERFSEISMGGDSDDNSYSLPVQGGGEWQN
jgi:hypothetical protein